jgi:hypothetical protein
MDTNITRVGGRVRRRVTVACCTGALIAAASLSAAGSAGATTPPDDSAPTGSAVPAEITPVNLTLTETSIDGLPTDLVAGAIDVTVTDETEGAGGSVNFTRVEPGTDQAAFAEGLAAAFGGGPLPDFFLNTSGVINHTMTTVDEGEYIVWMDVANNLDRESTVEDVVTAPLTVGAGDNDAVLPETDGSVRAGDYLFDVDVTAGGSTVTFTNSSDNQFHHVILVDFGSNDPAVVEDELPTLLASEEDAPIPEGIDPSQINFEFAEAPVMGPGGSATFDVTFEEGHTYAALCFISDREGGLPHAIQHGMYDVFQVGPAA